ncbi:MAG: hypothetical protein PVI90_02455 [Desulfobacteraceae bacterium]|jgi:hypothetical protein
MNSDDRNIDLLMKVEMLYGADDICGFIKEDPGIISKLVSEEGLPAWKKPGQRVWRALNIDLCRWMVWQRNKNIGKKSEFLENDF